MVPSLHETRESAARVVKRLEIPFKVGLDRDLSLMEDFLREVLA
jgi:hypothetical protein